MEGGRGGWPTNMLAAFLIELARLFCSGSSALIAPADTGARLRIRAGAATPPVAYLLRQTRLA